MTEAEKQFLIDLQGLLFFKSEQDKENLEKFIKKNEALSSLGAISYLTKQDLTETQKAQARENIGAGTGNGTGSIEGAVRYDKEQNLTNDDKTRARKNIGAGTGTWADMPDKPFYAEEDVSRFFDKSVTPNPVSFDVSDLQQTFYKLFDLTFSKEDFNNLTITITNANDYTSDWTFDESNIIFADSQTMLLQVNARMFVVAYKSGELILDMTSVLGATLTVNVPEVGIYCNEFDNTKKANLLIKGSVKPLDKKFLPEDIKLPDNIVKTENGIIPASYLPSYVDDVIEGYYVTTGSRLGTFMTESHIVSEGEAGAGFDIPGETGKIYVDLNTSNIYRWSGSVYVRLNPGEYTIATNEQILELFN